MSIQVNTAARENSEQPASRRAEATPCAHCGAFLDGQFCPSCLNWA